MPSLKLEFTDQAEAQLEALRTNPGLAKRSKSVSKALGYLESNPRHPGLNNHKYSDYRGPNGEDVFEAYAENRTPAAYRIFWYYGSAKGQIVILGIAAHP